MGRIALKNLVNFFEHENYPKTREEAEHMASQRGFDTIASITDNQVFIGRSKHGIWSAGMPQEVERIAKFISYESKHDRKIIFWADDFKRLAEVKRTMDDVLKFEQDDETGTFTDDKFLCHSTTLDSFISILADGELLSYSELTKRKRNINTVRHVLNEPVDYFDHVDLCSWNSISSEIVVASKQAGKIPNDTNLVYNPGIRMYFSSETVKKAEGFCSDGLHAGMVFKSLPLRFAHAFVVPNKDEFHRAICNSNLKLDDELQNKMLYLEGSRLWTPQEFVDESNKLVGKLKP